MYLSPIPYVGEDYGQRKVVLRYGSNLDLKQMEDRCPGAKKYDAGTLDGYTLIFCRGSSDSRSGVANVVPCTGGRVLGGLYKITPQDACALDRREGVQLVPYSYQRKPCEIKIGRKNVSAFYYSMNPCSIVKIPCEDYYKKIEDGYTEWELEMRFLKDAYDLTLKLKGMTLPDVDTHLQERSLGTHRT